MQQILFGGNSDALNNAATEYNAVGTGTSWDATESSRTQVVGAAGTIDSLFVELSEDPGTSPDAYRFTLRVNGASPPNGLVVTITADDTTGSDVAHSVAVVVGDVISIQCEPLETPSATPSAQWSMRFTGTTAKESLLLGHLATSNTVTRYTGASTGGASSSTTEDDVRQVCPTAGTIKNLCVNLAEDPGTDPDGYRFTLRVNGASPPNGLVVTITADAKTGSDTAHTVTVAAGDRLTLMFEPLNDPATTGIRTAFGMAFVADIDGESVMLGGSSNDLDNAATEYNLLFGCFGTTAWSATEADKQQLGQGCVLRKFYVLLSAAPGAGNTYTFTPRVNAASPADGLVVAIAGTDTTGNDTTHSIAVADGDNLALMCVPDSTPDIVDAYWGLVCQVPQTTAKAISGAAATAGTLPRGIGRSLSGIVSTIGTVLRTTAQSLDTATSTAVAVAERAVSRALISTAEVIATATRTQTSLKPVAAGTSEVTATVGPRDLGRSIAGTSEVAGTVGRVINRTITATVNVLGDIGAVGMEALSTGVGIGATVSRSVSRNLSSEAATVGTVTRAQTTAKTIAAASVSTAGSVKRNAARSLSGAVEAVGLAIRPLTAGKALEGASSASGTVGRATSKIVATATVETAATVTRSQVTVKALSASVATAATVGRSVNRSISATVATAASVSRSVSRSLSATAATVGTVSRAATWVKAIDAGLVSTVGTATRSAGLTIAGTAGTSATVTRVEQTAKALSASVATVGTIRPLAISRGILGTAATVGAAHRAITKTIDTAVVSTVGSVISAGVEDLSSGVSTIATVTRRVLRTATATATATATLTRGISRSLSATASTVASVTKGWLYTKAISAIMGGGSGDETLRPNAAGDETSIPSQYPASTYHWDKVDEEVADDDTTFVYNAAEESWTRDLYALPDHSVGSGTINKITIYLRIHRQYSDDLVRACLKTGGTVYESGNLGSTTGSWHLVSWEQTTNPKTSAAWTWDDIDALQIGANIYSDSGLTKVTQVYVVIPYTAPGDMSVGVTGTLLEQAGQVLTGQAATVGTVTRTISKAITGTVSTASTVSRQTSKTTTTATASTAATAARAVTKSVSPAVVSTVGTITTEGLEELSSGVSTAATVVRGVARTVTATVGTIGTISSGWKYEKTIATAVVSTVCAVTRDTARAISGTVSTVGVVRPLAVSRSLVGTAATAGQVVRSTARTLSATVATAGTVSRALIWAKAIDAAVVSTVGTIVTEAGQAVSAGASVIGTVSRSVSRNISAQVGTSGSVPRHTSRTLSGAAATIGTAARFSFVGKTLSAVVSTAGTVSRAFIHAKTLSGTATATGLSIRPLTVGNVLTGTVGTIGTRRPVSVGQQLTATASTVGTVKQFVYKRVATATVSTIGTIAYKPITPLAGGVAVAGDIIKRVSKSAAQTTVSTIGTATRITHIPVLKTIATAVVSTVGTVSTTLMDVLYAMNQTFRKIFAKVRITYTDPYFSAGVATSADAVGDYTYTDQTVDNVTTEEYKWFSLHRNALDGTYHPLPGDQSISVGWWGTQLSDFATNVFVPPYPTLTITHAARIVETLLVVGDDQLNEYPVNFNVYLYSTGDVLEHTENVTGNTLCTWTKSLSPAETGIVKQVLEITKWSRGDSVSKIAQFFTTLEQTYMSEDGDIVSLNMTEQREFSGTTIPQGNMASSEITVRLNNIEGIFDPGNTASPLYGLLLNNRAITAWLGVDLIPSGVRRWYPLGTFYSRDWSAPDSEIYAEVSGQDMLARLQSTTFSPSEVYESKTLQELAIIVLTDAGLTSADWDIDPTFDTITVPYAWFEAVSHRECLRKIVAAAMGQCYCDRDGKLVLEVYQAPSLNPFAYTTANTFTFDHPLQWSQMVNYVEAQAQPRVPSAEQNIVTDVEVITVPAGGTVTKLHFYSFSPCVDVQAPVITADPDVTVDSYTAYSWGISVTYANAGGGDETVTEVTVAGKMLEVQGSRVVVAQDAPSIAQNGKQSLSEPISSEFWQDEARAQTVADAILETYRNPRRDIVMRARGNIAQLLGDRVEAVDSWYAGTTAQYGIVGQDVSYDGGLEITVTAQQLGTRHEKALAVATVEAVGTAVRTRPTLKTIATATASTVGSIKRQTGKALAAVASTIGTISRVPAYALDIGPGAIDRAASAIAGYTRVDEGNPAAASGTLTSVELWFVTDATGVKVTTFTKSGTTFTPHAVATIGSVTAGSKQTFVISLAVAAGDYIGCYWATGTIEAAGEGGAGVWFCAGDKTGAAATYLPSANGVMSIFANGHL